MRVFMVCADPGIAPHGTKGASVHLRSMAAALARAGHDVVAFTRRAAAHGDAFPVPLRRLRDLVPSLAEGPDLVYERYALGEEGGLSAARRAGIPFALEVNAPLVLEATRHRPERVRPRDRDVEDGLFRAADLVFAVSEPLRRYVADRRWGDAGTAVVRNGCDPGRFPALAPLAGSTIAFLGHPKPWHGADALPGLLADLRERRVDARLLVIGGGPGAERIATRAARLGLGDRVEVTGPVDEGSAARLLSGASVSVAPYPPDPFFYFCPLKVIESMAAGVPVVAVAQGDLPAIVGDAGVMVRPGARTDLAEAIGVLLGDPDLRRELGARSRARALRRFTWDHAAASVADRASALIREAA